MDYLERRKQPKNLTELEAFCEEEWAKTRMERLLAGYRKHLQAVVLAKEGVT